MSSCLFPQCPAPRVDLKVKGIVSFVVLAIIRTKLVEHIAKRVQMAKHHQEKVPPTLTIAQVYVILFIELFEVLSYYLYILPIHYHIDKCEFTVRSIRIIISNRASITVLSRSYKKYKKPGGIRYKGQVFSINGIELIQGFNLMTFVCRLFLTTLQV